MREALKQKYPELKDSIEKMSDTAIEMVGILESITAEERKIFIKHFENRI